MEISCLPVLARGSKIVSVYMVYLQGMSHQFEINVINAFYNKFWNQYGKFFKLSWFLPFGIWKKWKLYVFNLLIFLWLIIFIACSIYWFFDDHDTWLLLLEYFWWFAQVSAVFERLFSCYFVVAISHTRKFRRNTQTTLVFFEKSWANIFLKPFASLFLQFNYKKNRGFFFFFLRIVYIWRNSWTFTL